jgi:cation transport regulator ChaC
VTVRCYFAYGSNMNPDRARARGLAFDRVESARLPGFHIAFHKRARDRAGVGRANLVFDRDAVVEGVLFHLESPAAIEALDRHEGAPVHYSRDVVVVESAGGSVAAWTYFANPAVLVRELAPDRAYLEQLLAGAPFLSSPYVERLRNWPCCADAT